MVNSSIPCHGRLDGLSVPTVPTAEDGTDLWFVALRNIPEGSAAAKRNLHLAFGINLLQMYS